ncbi:energy-coupling factor ABC transporter ATP-binding protein [Fructilactobacillus cliffordii]|uniref:ATP-binding cassette domain-containing protein n=1 Tax=Fructilactobacillus cliffordii TaxID=2940299 RepID=UPI002093A4F5|nr:ATP-binding cassette domain-containing protein [Fructilactobacillus cliffordii]USS86093.1 energy-coupling factor ABC transporter ATP-binding protein [Fructilactobacillus cliffordii]
MAIEIKNLTHWYPDQPTAALQSISLTIPDHEITAIVGKTGSGKSTLIKHLNGLLQPTTGEIEIVGQRLTQRSLARDLQRVRQQVGMVFQNPAQQLFAKTVLDDVMAGPVALGMERDQAQQRAQTALQLVHFPVRLQSQDPVLLSSGQQRRAAIAGVLALEPQVVIFDEPTAGLDAQGQRELLHLLRDLQSVGRTIIMVTHEMDLVAQLASQVVVLANGQLAFAGAPRTLFQSEPELVRSTNLVLPEPLQVAQTLDTTTPRSELPLTETELQRWLLRYLGRDDDHGSTSG